MQNEVKSRDIDYVWHFTKIENVDSILANGLIPRATLEAQGAAVAYNDQYRIDGQRTANCLSIGHPNYKMFYSLRCQDSSQIWVVVAFKPEILWLKDCAFCFENAASNNVAAIPIQNRKGVAAFRRMFDPVAGKPNRETLKLPDDCPTNPQAEILVFDTIEPQYVEGVITPDKQTEQALKAKYPNFDFLYHRAFYSARLDYEYW
ncbi:DarT ssDNA thymidine ADP-ribosyltransferase family protein [Alteromonas stellipolaris]|uniref:DarT ssDNA thymidine ADP-ribosyltransferase family protein n=1 Tax=Alteromonas stellipolaris TaxID=233316 RepID=UPI0026E11BEA|nr:DarT ssDNA thymidine ADP-ribosyltransferase family protein [Alteromonas stellipolaris]MDO6537965.1 DarT ssDNA thymidine ADP-ribosyltransferase family protein [Alteromonas stellipolaris]